MKKRVLCLLLAIVAVMSVVPLTAYAETVPEECRGTYRGKATLMGERHDFSMTVTENNVMISIPDLYFDMEIPYCGYYDRDRGDLWFRLQRTSNGVYVSAEFILSLACWDANLRSSFFVDTISFKILNKNANNGLISTLSTGSGLIIPVTVGVLALGAVIFIVKRKKKEAA